MVEQALYRRVTMGTTISATEMAAYYARHWDEFRLGVSRRIEFVAFDSAGAARRLAGRPRLPHDEVQVVIVERSRIASSTWVTVARLPARRTSRPLRLGNGWFVIRPISAVLPPHQAPLTAVAGPLRARLLQARKQMRFERWVARATARASIAYG
jgi:hypothetical protein